MLLRRILFITLGIFSVFLLLFSAYLTYQELARYQETLGLYPAGSEISGLPVGGLDRQTALRRLEEAFLLPLELHYGEAVIHLVPEAAGLRLDESSIPAPPGESTGEGFWRGFWAHLMGRAPEPVRGEVRLEYSPEQVRAYLEQEIIPRYDQPPAPAEPVQGTPGFRPGAAGTSLELEAALSRIDGAITSRTERTVQLPLQDLPPGPPRWENLELLLRHTVRASGFDGILDLYLVDLEHEREIHFATWGGRELSIEPDIAFTASSIIKIPIMVSVFRRLDTPPDAATDSLLKVMFSSSSNEAADALMKTKVDEVRGPLLVSEDLHALGFQSSFLAGYFGLGSPLLQIFETPANRRADVDTDPDLYNQTTPGEIGRLLVDLYRCAQGGPSGLLRTFEGEITREECQAMIGYLKEDREPYLIKAGLPDGTEIGHKHGYGSAGGTIYTIGDAGLVFTPGGDYMLSVFTHHPQLLLWDKANGLVVQLSRVIYNYFNVYASP